MACVTFEKQISIRADADAIYAELCDPERQVGLQPLLVETEERLEAATSASRSFIAIEAVPVAFGWTLRHRIEVRIERTRPGQVVDFHTRAFPRIRIHSRFTMTPNDVGTKVQQCFRLEVPRGLRTFVAARAESAQAELLRNLEKRLEDGREAT